MAAKLFYLPFPTAFSSNGLPAAGAKLFFYLTGTLTLQDVYTTSALTTTHANPVVADGSGRYPVIYTNDAINLRLIIKDAAGATLADVDPYIPGAAGSPGTAGANAATPNWTIATGAAGTNVVVTGTYPTQTITIPRGTPGASGALGDADYGDITVTGTGTVLTVDPGAITLAKMANLAANSFILNNTGAAAVPIAGTVAQAKTLLAISNVDNTSDANKPVSTAQATSIGTKAPLTPREQSVASSATVTPTFLDDVVNVTAQAVALQLGNPTGTAVPNHGIVVRIKDNGTARLLTYDTQYRVIGTTLPTTTVANKTIYLGIIFNAASTNWDVVSVLQQA